MTTPVPDPIPNPNPPPRPLPEPAPPPYPSPPGPPQPPGPSRRLYVLAGAFVLFHSMSVAADDPASAARKVRGFVVAVETNSILVSVRGVNQQFAVADDAKITRNGDPATLQELQPRDRVRMTVQASGESRSAIKIRAHAPLQVGTHSPPIHGRLTLHEERFYPSDPPIRKGALPWPRC